MTLFYVAVRDDVTVGARLEARWWRWPGAALPIVLLHEGLGSVGLWREFPAALATRTGRSVFAYSRRGYGDSEARGGPLPLDFMEREAADVVPRVLDAAGIDRAVLLGHSDGASIALLAAAAWPARIAALVIEAPHVFVEDLTLASIADARERYRSTDLRARLARHHRHVDEAFHGWNDVWLDPEFKSWNIEPVLPHVGQPLLVLQGLQDEYGTAFQLRAIERQVDGPVVTMLIQKCGHSPHRDQRAAVLHHAAGFLTPIP
jgi:pimeloyl-ACP methyl ester carboxylesterase